MKWKSKPWQLQDAKAKFSQVFEKALTEGPQIVTRRNKDEVVIVRRSDFEAQRPQSHIVDLLLAAPHAPEFKVQRSGSTGRHPPTFA